MQQRAMLEEVQMPPRLILRVVNCTTLASALSAGEPAPTRKIHVQIELTIPNRKLAARHHPRRLQPKGQLEKIGVSHPPTINSIPTDRSPSQPKTVLPTQFSEEPSPFCLGAMTFGEDWGWGSSVSDSERILDHYIDRGGNFIDTANAYTKGHSEKIIGDHVGRDRKKRDRLVIATKFMCNLFLGDPNGGGASRKAIIGQCEESLRRLQTDYIDLYWMHVWDRLTPIEETMTALDTLVRQGKVATSGSPIRRPGRWRRRRRWRNFATPRRSSP